MLLGRDDRARDVYALLGQGECREIAQRLDTEGVVTLDLPASIVRRLADFLTENPL